MIALRVLTAAILMFTCGSPRSARADEATSRAIRFLTREVESWPRKQGCYSCHNTGDAVRALAIAKRRGYAVDADKLQSSLAWLRQPDGWKKNKGDQRFSDHQLSELQFSAALLEASRAELLAISRNDQTKLLQRSAQLVAARQKPDGEWQLIRPGTLASPISYGRFLGTVLARDVLRGCGQEKEHAERLKKADEWLRSTPPRSVIDAAAVLLGIGHSKEQAVRPQQERALKIIARGQAPGGGWGAYVTSPPEVFDSALVVIALASLGQPHADQERMLRAGRRYLIAEQAADGSWPETTRPAGSESYAHRISTSAWATIALVESKRVPGKSRKP